MLQSNVHSNQIPSIFVFFPQEPGKKMNTVLRQKFSQLQISDIMPLTCFIIVLMIISHAVRLNMFLILSKALLLFIFNQFIIIILLLI